MNCVRPSSQKEVCPSVHVFFALSCREAYLFIPYAIEIKCLKLCRIKTHGTEVTCVHVCKIIGGASKYY